MIEDIDELFDVLIAARKRYATALLQELRAKEALKKEEMLLYLTDSINGKNAEIREAQKNEKTIKERHAVTNAEIDKITALCLLQCAQDDVERLKLLSTK